jgi:hypothetical protein
MASSGAGWVEYLLLRPERRPSSRTEPPLGCATCLLPVSMFLDSWLQRWSASTLSGLLVISLLLALFGARAVGRRRSVKEQAEGLSSLEAMASGLVGLLLAFNFSFAQSRFDDREKQIVRDADAIGTTYLRCSVLDDDDRRACRAHLRDYAETRVAAYAAYGRSDMRELAALLDEGDQIQNELWSMVTSRVRENPDVPHALVMTTLNELIDLDADRRASVRIVVPPAVTIAIMLACLAWAVLLGYSSGVQRRSSWTGWVFVSLLIGVVFGVALDLDRPASGLVTTAAADRSMTDVLRMMQRTVVD